VRRQLTHEPLEHLDELPSSRPVGEDFEVEGKSLLQPVGGQVDAADGIEATEQRLSRGSESNGGRLRMCWKTTSTLPLG
jgi:hypothetical protein